jgi:hypothetical protein
VAADEGVDPADLLVGQPRIRLGDGDEPVAVPDAEGVVGVEAGPLAAAALGGDQDGVDGERVDLPLPPVATTPADPNEF